MNWKEFEDSYYWQEIVKTIKDRITIIERDLHDPILTPDIAQVRKFQGERESCLWLLSLPRIITEELKSEVHEA